MNELKEKVVIIIDGNAIARKCFHAVTSPNKGKKFSIINNSPDREFLKLLRLQIQNFIKRKNYCKKIIVFDRKDGNNFRKKIFPEYKANRDLSKVDESFYHWVESSKNQLNNLGFEIYIPEDGYEGDDQIGTIAKKFSEKFFYIEIFTIDKDLLQLVNEFISVYLVKKSFSTVLHDLKNFARLNDGLLPHQIPLLKALAGDSSDNYPGMPDIGEKRAINLINQFGSEDNFLKNYQNIQDLKIKISISENIEKLKLYLEIAKIRTDLSFSL